MLVSRKAYQTIHLEEGWACQSYLTRVTEDLSNQGHLFFDTVKTNFKIKPILKIQPVTESKYLSNCKPAHTGS